MGLSPRLAAVAALVRPGTVVADVGADHGYLIAELLESGRCRAGYASDLRPNPLASAQAHLAARGLLQRVQTVCCSGLDGLPAEKIDEVVVAGMGGELIAEIVERCPALRNPAKGLILQPMTKPDLLRRRLYEMGFAATDEVVAAEGGRLFLVLRAEYTGRPRALSELEARTGLLADARTPEALRYLRAQQAAVSKAARSMANGARTAARAAEFRALAIALGTLCDGLEQRMEDRHDQCASGL